MWLASNLLFLAIGLVAISCVSADETVGTYVGNPDLKIWRNTLSPNGSFRIVIYQHDKGALGYGRVIWTVTPANLDRVDLTKFKLPDGYRTENWTKDSDLEISRWEPYYFLQDYRELRDGDSFHGVSVRLIENKSKYELPGYEERSEKQ